MTAGATYNERLLMAGNGNGKTETAAYEISRHMTGEYPPWWKGVRFDKPVRVWLAGTSSKAVTEAAQTKLLGPPGNADLLGTGFIPKEAIIGSPRPSRGYPDAVESFQVLHTPTGGISRCVVKTYSQEREDWQGADIDVLWCDEEPPEDLYTEGRARLRGRGMTLVTFTPLLGMSAVVCRYMEQADPQRYMVRMGVKDALWYPPEAIANMIAGYPAHEREARANGDPLLGSGKVFTVPADDLKEPFIPFDRVPLAWRKIWGIDLGIDHPFAAVLLAYDMDQVGYDAAHEKAAGTAHVLATIRMTGATAVQHAEAMKKVAANVPVAWPHDGNIRRDTGGSLEQIAKIYRGHGLNMLDSHATHVTGGYGTYAGITDMDAYMQARQWRVADTCTDWFGEYGQYHYDKGVLVKVRDDLLSATRIGHMMRRRAKAIPLGSKRARRDHNEVARDQDAWLADF